MEEQQPRSILNQNDLFFNGTENFTHVSLPGSAATQYNVFTHQSLRIRSLQILIVIKLGRSVSRSM